jgi:hypothetical protein
VRRNRRTHPSVRSVQLVGSWDNFSNTYAMERDSRRDRGQWRGTHTFKDIICDGDSPKSTSRNGGLRMGQTYYYYVRFSVVELQFMDPKLTGISV